MEKVLAAQLATWKRTREGRDGKPTKDALAAAHAVAREALRMMGLSGRVFIPHALDRIPMCLAGNVRRRMREQELGGKVAKWFTFGLRWCRYLLGYT